MKPLLDIIMSIVYKGGVPIVSNIITLLLLKGYNAELLN